jgi:hypothetical protein
MTPNELERYNHLKTTVILRLFHFIVLLLDKFPKFRVPIGSAGPVGMNLEGDPEDGDEADKVSAWFGGADGAHLDTFFRLLLGCILCPTTPEIGFVYAEEENGGLRPVAGSGASSAVKPTIQSPGLRGMTTRLCKLMQSRLCDGDIQVMREALRATLARPENDIRSIDFGKTST